MKSLCIAALARSLDAPLAAELTGVDDGAHMLQRFADRGLGTWEKDAVGEMRFVFDDGVQAEARDILRQRWADEKRDRSRFLAERFFSEGHVERAFDLAIQSEDIELIARIGMRAFPFSTDFAREALDLVTGLPLARVLTDPVVALWVAIQLSLSSHPGIDSGEIFAATMGQAHARSPRLSDTERLLVLGLESYGLRRAGDARASGAKAARFAEMADAMIANSALDDSLEHAFASIAYQVGVSLIYSDDHARAAGMLADLEIFCRTRGIAYRVNSIVSARAYIAAIEGRVERSQSILRDVADDAWPQAWPGGNIRTYFVLTHIVNAVLTADFTALRAAVAEFSASVRETEHWDVFLLGALVLDLADGSPAAARSRFDALVKVRLTASTHPAVRRRLRIAEKLLQAAGHPSTTPTEGARPTPPSPPALALGAHAELTRQRSDQAAALLGKAMTIASTPADEHFCFAVLARQAILNGDAQTAQHALTHLGFLQQVHGLRIALALVSADERRLAEAWRLPRGSLDLLRSVRPLGGAPALASGGALTAREREVLRELARHGERMKVARSLYLSPATVKVHIRSIYRKLGVRTQADAIQRAAAAGLLHGGALPAETRS